MISIVNGYVCTSPCEAASARQGKDPHAPLGSPADKTDKASPFAGQPATVLGGALKDAAGSNPISAADITQQLRPDRLA
jgi:hypothetical protein